MGRVGGRGRSVVAFEGSSTRHPLLHPPPHKRLSREGLAGAEWTLGWSIKERETQDDEAAPLGIPGSSPAAFCQCTDVFSRRGAR